MSVSSEEVDIGEERDLNTFLPFVSGSFGLVGID